MRVLYLAPERTSSGRYTATSVIDEEIDALAAAGVEVHVLSPAIERNERRNSVVLHGSGPRHALRRLGHAGFLLKQVHRVGAWSCAANARYCQYVTRIEFEAAELIRRQRIDLVHSHFGFPGGIGGLLASRATGSPLVTSLRGMELACEPALGYGLRMEPFFDRAVRRLLEEADRTIYVSDFMRQEGVALGAAPERAITIRKGVDLEKFRTGDAHSVRAELGAVGPMVLIVSNLLPVKGVDDAIKALGLLGTACRFTLVICGSGPQRDALERLAEEVGIAERTRFVGKIGRDRIPDYFAAADIFVLPSVREASGNVLLEAAAAGKPTVCTASGGPPEYVEDGTTGFVARPRDPASLAEKLRLLLQSEELRTRMGTAARRHAESEFSYERMIGKLLDVYRSALRDRA